MQYKGATQLKLNIEATAGDTKIMNGQISNFKK